MSLTLTLPPIDEAALMDGALMEMDTMSRDDNDLVPMVIESCHSTWIFDHAHGRFRRIVTTAGSPDFPPAMTQWRPFSHVELLEDDSFVVWLDPQGRRLLRSWRHAGDDCPDCALRSTGSISLASLHKAAAP